MSVLIARLRLVLLAFGWRGVVRRLRYEAALRSGALRRRLPMRGSFASSPELVWQRLFDLDEIRARYRSLPDVEALRARVVAQTERMLSGEMPFYGDDWREVGSPPRWHVNAFTGYEYPKVHWTEIPDDDASRGDIKDVWEISRLPFTFFLARAYVLSGDDRYPEHWWQLLEDWAEHNPPNTGVNWRCGQETSLRAISICFGLSVFTDHPASTPARLDLANRILGASAERVRQTVAYALSQRNNHAVSELVFLLSVRAKRDERCLLGHLLEVLDDQFYPDGSYSQQSFTYQRLAVQGLQWLLVVRADLPQGVQGRVCEVLARSRDFLSRCSDPVSGWLPNYGPNDGALLLHLSGAHYRDFRPLLASLGASADSKHGEPAIWLDDQRVSARATTVDQAPTTYIVLRGPRSIAFSRIGTGRHRSGHGDQQAVDLWINGKNVVPDPGTYRYTAPAPWRNALTRPEVHSLALEDGASQLSAGRFLSEHMPAAELVHRSWRAELEVVVSRRHTRDGRLVRAIVRRGDAYAIVDAAEDAEGRVRWNIGDIDGIEIRMDPPDDRNTPPPTDEDPASGWISPIYGKRQPIDVRSVQLRAGAAVICRLGPATQPQLQAGDLQQALADAGLRGVRCPCGRRAPILSSQLRSQLNCASKCPDSCSCEPEFRAGAKDETK